MIKAAAVVGLWPEQQGFSTVLSYPAHFLIHGSEIRFPSKNLKGIIVSGIRFQAYQVHLEKWEPVRVELTRQAGKPWEEIKGMYRGSQEYVLLRLQLT